MKGAEMGADDALLKGMKGGAVVNVSGAVMQRKESARPKVDKVIAKRPAGAVGQSLTGLPQEIDQISRSGDRHIAADNFVQQCRRRNGGLAAPCSTGGE